MVGHEPDLVLWLAKEPSEHRLQPILCFLRRELWSWRLFTDDQCKLGNQVGNELSVREVAPIDWGFDERRELWRLWCYLAVATVEQQSTPFGRTMFRRLSDAANRYQ